MNLQDYYKQLNEIPEENFITDRFTDGVSKCCVIGHLNRLASGNPDDYFLDNCSDSTKPENPLRKLSMNYMMSKYNIPIEIAIVNNGTTGYWGDLCKDKCPHLFEPKTPKQRSLLLLKEMIDAGINYEE